MGGGYGIGTLLGPGFGLAKGFGLVKDQLKATGNAVTALLDGGLDVHELHQREGRASVRTTFYTWLKSGGRMMCILNVF